MPRHTVGWGEGGSTNRLSLENSCFVSFSRAEERNLFFVLKPPLVYIEASSQLRITKLQHGSRNIARALRCKLNSAMSYFSRWELLGDEGTGGGDETWRRGQMDTAVSFGTHAAWVPRLERRYRLVQFPCFHWPTIDFVRWVCSTSSFVLRPDGNVSPRPGWRPEDGVGSYQHGASLPSVSSVVQ